MERLVTACRIHYGTMLKPPPHLEQTLEQRGASIRNSKGETLSVRAVATLYTTFFSSAESEHLVERRKRKPPLDLSLSPASCSS